MPPPPTGFLPIIQKFVAIYKAWNEYRDHFLKKYRYTLGEKIDFAFLNTIEPLLIASYLNKQEKTPYLKKASVQLDLLKFFLQIAWELKAIDSKKYAAVSKQLNEIGKMLGGWLKGVDKGNSRQ